MLSTNEIGELTVHICCLPNNGIFHTYLEYLQQDVDCMYAVVVSLRRAAAANLRTDRRLVFVLQPIFEGKAERAGLADEEKSYP